MKSRDFVYWLQGYFEITVDIAGSPSQFGMNAAQLQIIKNHLNMVFIHEIDPSMGDKEEQTKLDAAHQAANLQPAMHGPSGEIIHTNTLVKC